MSTKYEVGQEVIVESAVTWGGRSVEYYDGTIVKVGRTLVTIEFGFHHSEQFYMDSGRSKGDHVHYLFYTPEEFDLRERRAAAEKTLADSHVTVGSRSTLTVAQMEALAAVVTPTGRPTHVELRLTSIQARLDSALDDETSNRPLLLEGVRRDLAELRAELDES